MHAQNKSAHSHTGSPKSGDPDATSRDPMRHGATFCDVSRQNALPNLTPTPGGVVASATGAPAPTAELTPLQLTAISLITTGANLQLTATKLHIHRGTLHRWRTQHPAFIAELNRRLFELHDTASRRLHLALLHAVDTLTDEIRTGTKRQDRVHTAVSLLRHIDLTPLLAPPTTLTTAACTDALIRHDRQSRNCHPSMEVDDYDRTQYLAHVAAEERADPVTDPTPTHRRLRGATPYPTPDNAPQSPEFEI